MLTSRRGPTRWRGFSYEGSPYASWLDAPRYFPAEEHPERWEALRKYLVRAREFLGGRRIYVGQDLLYAPTPEDATERERFFLPPRLPDEWVAVRDLGSRAEPGEIEELAGLTW
jgi:hypothetical protein